MIIQKQQTNQIKEHLILSLLFIFMFSGCGETKSMDNNQETSNNNTAVVLIFCDLTASVDSSSIRKVARDAYNLIFVFPYQTRLIIYPIDESPFVKPILDFTYPSKATKNSQIHKNKIWIRNVARSAYDSIINLYHAEYSNSKTGSRPISCIMRSLETAHCQFMQFKDVSGKKYSYELIYLSDMLEECGTSPVGPVAFTKKYFRNSLERLEAYQPEFDLSYANVSIIISVEQYAMESAYISYEELKTAWKKVFMKVGFSAERIEGFNFLPTIPPKFDLRNSVWR